MNSSQGQEIKSIHDEKEKLYLENKEYSIVLKWSLNTYNHKEIIFIILCLRSSAMKLAFDFFNLGRKHINKFILINLKNIYWNFCMLPDSKILFILFYLRTIVCVHYLLKCSGFWETADNKMYNNLFMKYTVMIE